MTKENKEIKEINDTVWATLAPSKIAGVGVIAIRNIKKGTYLKETPRSYSYMFSNKEFMQIKKEIRNLILDRQMMSMNYISFKHPNTDANLQSFMNHSNNPNSNGHCTLKDISKGEEITEDYKTLTDDIKEINPILKKHWKFLKV